MTTPAFTPGEPVQHFHDRSEGNPRYAFDTVAGRRVMVLIPGPFAEPGKAERRAAMGAPHAAWLDVTKAGQREKAVAG